MSANPVDSACSVRFGILPTASGSGIATVTLDQPKSLNALSLSMVKDIHAQLRTWRDDPRIVAIWLEATSDKAFCAGADLRTLYNAMCGKGVAATYVADFFAAEYRLDYHIHNYGKPVIAWMHGITMGGGIGLGSGASHRVVTELSQFAMPEISIGLFPDVAASWFLGRIPGRMGRYVGLTGARLTAADTLFAGLADVPIPHSSKAAVLADLQAARWYADSERNDAVIRRVLLNAADWSLAATSDLARRAPQLMRLCNAATLAECVEAIHVWAQQDAWAQPHSTMLREGSPISAGLAWELQRRLQHASLADVFRLEYAAALGCAATDFAEGIRALIIDKDRTPRWQYKSIADLPGSLMEELLAPHWSGQHPLSDLH